MNQKSLCAAITSLMLMTLAGPSLAREIPSSSTYPVELEQERILCQGFTPNLPGLCEAVARDFYGTYRQYVIATMNGIDDAVSLVFAPGATVLYPDGTYSVGPNEASQSIPALFGSTNFKVVDIENKFVYKPLDLFTIAVLGNQDLSLQDDQHGGEIRSLRTTQIAIYRRSLPAGGVKWTEILEQFGYDAPVLGVDP